MKDPAFLFYPGDFITGTYTMTNEQVGKYIRLLCIQHAKGSLLEKDMINICGTYDKDIFDKFTLEDGNYFNRRLRQETDKRLKYSESRRNNRVKKDMKNICETYDKHMENENENINENINEKEKGVQGEKPKWAENFKNYNPEIIYPFQFPEFSTAWDLWVAYRKEKHIRGYKLIGEQAALKNLSEISNNNLDTAIKIINQSISQNWQGLFELKINGNKRTGIDSLKEINRLVDEGFAKGMP
ncbi:MAG: YdaU family protein [Bacteroidales bacterium]|nr:YdaU family protein [Bacteroidales bacterium]